MAVNHTQRVQIERVGLLPPEIFMQRFLSGRGMPVVVTGALESWKARSGWSFEFFKSRYGGEGVTVHSKSSKSAVKLTKLGDFIDYLDSPGGRSPGFWIDSKTKLPLAAAQEEPEAPWYLVSWPTFSRHPELLDDLTLTPPFVEDWLPLLPKAFRELVDGATRYFSSGVLIGSEGSQLGLHYDLLDTHAYLAMIAGRKRCLLFSPDDGEAVYDGKVDPDRPDLARFPRFQDATAFECILEPGELLFIPSRWWHHVVGLEKSITLNYNFFNRVNYGNYMMKLLQGLPDIVGALEKSPGLKSSLGIDWVSRGFDVR